MKDKILIFSFPRTGSTTLLRILRLQNINMPGFEPFNVDQETSGNLISRFNGVIRNRQAYFKKRSNMENYLDYLFTSYEGFKHLTYQLDVNDNKHLLLRSKNCRIVFLWRRNYIQQVVSNLIATQTRIWNKWQNNLEKIEKTRYDNIKLEPEIIKNQCALRRNEKDSYLKFLKEHNFRFMDVCYEDLFDADLKESDKIEKLNEILRFLEREEIKFSRKTQILQLLRPFVKQYTIEKIMNLLDPKKTRMLSEEIYRKLPNVGDIMNLESADNGYLFKANSLNSILFDNNMDNSNYQRRDHQIIDYKLFHLANMNLMCRGPKPRSLEKGKYIACSGAAQTFGCFCEKPYPNLLEERLSFPVLNLGKGGSGPCFFLRDKELLKFINHAKFAIIQVMSARGEDNSLFSNMSGGERIIRRSDGIEMRSIVAYDELLQKENKNYIKKIINETRASWINNYKLLLNAITAPKSLFWFSKRKPDYTEDYRNVHRLFGGFPQLVNLQMVNELRPCCDEYIECTTDRGSPQLLINRFTGGPTKGIVVPNRKLTLRYNSYYPSPEMQIDAADGLESACRNLLKSEL